MLLNFVNNMNKKRLCILLFISKLKETFHHKTFLFMHNLKTNFDKILKITKSFFEGSIDANGNYYFYPRRPKMSDCEIIALSILGEAIGIDSENYLFGKIKSDHLKDFPNLIDRSRFNRRRKRLSDLIARLNNNVSSLLNEGENIYLVDSIPIPICRNARKVRSKICKEDYETAPDKGYSAAHRTWYYGFKLHIATSLKGVYSSMELTKASVHDIHFLDNIKYSGINNCAVIADKAYASKPVQIDLFTTKQIILRAPPKDNQKNMEHIPFIYMKARKRIETLFSQLCDQQMLKRNYAKTTAAVSLRLLCKITSVTLLQYINFMNNKPLNHLKYALAS